MESANRFEREQAHTVKDALERLAKEANRERRAIGYPERQGKIIYSNTVRQLAREARELGFSSGVIASTAMVTPQTVQKWFKETPQPPFRELRIVPSAVPGEESSISLEKRETSAEAARRLTIILPSGVRVLMDRQDLDAELLGLLSLARGV